MLRSSIFVAAVVTLAVAIGGCGGSSGHSTTATPVPTASQSGGGPAPALSGGSRADRRSVLATVNGYYAALAAHHGQQGCGYLTPAAQRHVVVLITAHTSQFGRTCTQILGGVGLLLSGQVRVVSGTVRMGTAALVIQGKAPGSMTLTKSSGRWLISSTS